MKPLLEFRADEVEASSRRRHIRASGLYAHLMRSYSGLRSQSCAAPLTGAVHLAI